MGEESGSGNILFREKDTNDGPEMQAMYAGSTLRRERCDAARAANSVAELHHLVLEKVK